ncbi:hypothetical protein BG003_011153 [Podila horticola]|nr:hypothetical protein BG003_011153 [Podila horticola]
MPSVGQSPKDFGLYGQPHRFFVTEQMLELWNDMRGDKKTTYRRILSGPTGVGKSYLSYFLVARAYAEGWLVLYISDAGVLDKKDENESASEIVKRFLALNNDILTGAELEMLVNDYDGSRNIARNALSVIFGDLLMSWNRKTLLLVDEHRKLFETEPYVPDKFRSLVHLSSYHSWGEEPKGSRVIFTDITHVKYEMTILDDSYRLECVVFVAPLSRNVFSNLLDTYPRLSAPAIKKEVTEITNCVPRELVYLSANVKDLGPISVDDLQKWTESRTKDFLSIAETYYYSLCPFMKGLFYKDLLQMLLGSTGLFRLEWEFVDLGLNYRSDEVGKIGTQLHILCRPAQNALLELFKSLSLPKNTKRGICDGSLSRDEFETALCHHLICATKPIVLNATDLNGKNPTILSLRFSHCDTLQIDKMSLESGHKNVLIRSDKGYHPRFDFILGPLFIQASINDFESHNTGSADIRKAFNDRDNEGTNEIERHLNGLFGPGHSARISDNRFVVTKDGVPVPGFRIVYIRGSPGKPAHGDWATEFPDIRHITFEELKENLF